MKDRYVITFVAMAIDIFERRRLLTTVKLRNDCISLFKCERIGNATLRGYVVKICLILRHSVNFIF